MCFWALLFSLKENATVLSSTSASVLVASLTKSFPFPKFLTARRPPSKPRSPCLLAPLTNPKTPRCTSPRRPSLTSRFSPPRLLPPTSTLPRSLIPRTTKNLPSPRCCNTPTPAKRAKPRSTCSSPLSMRDKIFL
eukprot:Lithocolla_globosa_v1_NODE_5359_length_1253_cov_21602.800667.p6 type:complete len:135 gc:universal NODE_5359_length_1253_cov_21602.800667:833-1237(+)